MLWEEYLLSKKIDSGSFKKSEPHLWTSWKALFEQMHPNSFTAQKLYLINPIRRKYPFQESDMDANKSTKRPVAKPKIGVAKPKMAKPKPVFKKPKID